MGEYADESVVDVASSATMVRMVFFIIQKCFVLYPSDHHITFLQSSCLGFAGIEHRQN
jgi:hypothetical protein